MRAHNGTAGRQRSFDNGLKRWIRNVAHRWHNKSKAETARILGLAWGEVANRTGQYAKLGEELRRSRLNMQIISGLLHDCYALGNKFDDMRLKSFLDDSRSTSAILNLIRDFPKKDNEVAKRIDAFIERAVSIAYNKPKGGNEYSRAALLASVLLTSLDSQRFVDYRRNRWEEMAEAFNWKFSDSDYGEELVQAGRFAKAVCNTKTFKRYWPKQEPLWALSGICWVGHEPEGPLAKDTPPDDIPDENGFPEGKAKEVLHRTHERDQTVVKLAKQYAWQRDKTLPCEVCEFSFIKKYGKLGEEFIEAHHKKPVASLKPDQPTKVEDIALVCANCHRMLHEGSKTLTIDELRSLLQY